MRIFPTPPYRDEAELLDSPHETAPRDLEHTLRDIRRANIFGLGTWVVKHHLARLLRDWPRDEPVNILDLATGSADIPEELCRWGRRRGLKLRVVATDKSEAILAVGRRRIRTAGLEGSFSFAVCDATRPSFREGSFDVIICSLAFHHFNVKQAERALGELARLARVGFIVNDVYRAGGALYMAWLLGHFTTTSRLTKHDGPASVLRAYTPAELRRLSARCSVAVRIYRHPFWRVAVVGRRGA
jgi:ubiquinone/menaquinone biosynthesis C-methylase UbiE